MKGIILAGGSGTRLYPATKVVSKQLLPLYDKPMIYYPLSVLMLAGIREILIISNQRDLPLYKSLFGSGETIGINFSYVVQNNPNGIAEAFILGEDFIGTDSVCLILGDNIFYGQGLTDILTRAKDVKNNAVIFGVSVKNPSEFGVVELLNDKIISIEEKPSIAKSNLAIPGLYFYPNDVIEKSKTILKSSRGELEITSVNNLYLNENRLEIEVMGRGIAWLDTGSPKSMLLANQFIHVIQERQNTYIACIEEIAFRRNFITKNQLSELGDQLKSSDYGKYILSLLEES
jgi:glucose-1-phosphate thymidylyltransferase